MTLETIKNKYKQILEQPQSEEDSDGDWELACSKMHRRKPRSEHQVLAESQVLNKSKYSQNPDCALLKTKEKLAQTIANLNKKDQEFATLSQKNLQLNEQNKSLRRQIQTLNTTVSDYERQIIDHRVARNVIQKQIQALEKKCEEHTIDKDLMLNQIHFYQQQVQTLKVRLNYEKKQFDSIVKDINNLNKVKTQNDRLRSDVKRLHYLLQESSQYHKLPKIVNNCHYLGKAQKESDMWFPQDIIGETQHFCRKWQLGSNHQFINNLVKFIQKQLKRSVKETTGRVKKLECSRRRDIEKRQNRSLCVNSILQSNSLGRSQQLANSNFLKGSRRHSYYPQSRKQTEPFLCEKLEKSLAAHQQIESKKLCIELFEEFRHAIMVVLAQPKPKKRKILKLIDWVCESGIELISNEIQSNKSYQIKIRE